MPADCLLLISKGYEICRRHSVREEPSLSVDPLPLWCNIMANKDISAATFTQLYGHHLMLLLIKTAYTITHTHTHTERWFRPICLCWEWFVLRAARSFSPAYIMESRGWGGEERIWIRERGDEEREEEMNIW